MPMRRELVADAVGFGEVLGLARGVARRDTASRSLPWRATAAAHCSACHAFSSPARKPKKPSVPASARRPGGVLQAVHLGDRLRRVEVVEQRIEHARRRPRIGLGGSRIEKARQRLLGLFQPLHRPVDRLPVMAAEHREPHHIARPVRQHLADDDEVAEALAHLLAFDLQEAVVHPEIRHHRLNGTRSTTARSRSRGAGTPGRCRRRECRRSRRDASTTSPSIRCASPAGPAS